MQCVLRNDLNTFYLNSMDNLVPKITLFEVYFFHHSGEVKGQVQLQRSSPRGARDSVSGSAGQMFSSILPLFTSSPDWISNA